MQKKLIIIGTFLLSFTIAYSQPLESKTLELSPNLGYSSANVYRNILGSFNPRNSVRFGLMVDYYLDERWSIQSGLSFDPLGARILNSELKLNYLNAPINMNWHFGKTGRWNLNFGLSPGLLLEAENDQFEIIEEFNSLQLGFSCGIGHKIFLSKNLGIFINWQGLFGFTSIFESEDFTTVNTAASINVGAALALKPKG